MSRTVRQGARMPDCPFVVDGSGGYFEVFIRGLYRLVGILSDALFSLIYRGQTEELPPIRNKILLESATRLAEMIRRRQATSEETVLSFIERIREVNPVLNCISEDRFKAALIEAKTVDIMIASGKKSEISMAEETPFLGVPFTAKDPVAIKGMKLTIGLWSRRNYVSDEDAEVIRLMRKAGAIPLAHTTVPEVSMWWETANTIHGRTRNPYVTSRTAGGSSGGEGALLAAAGSPLGIGADIGGSIRMPCFFNGIFGLKPSSNMVSLEGYFPAVKDIRKNLLVIGPMSRHACDLLPVYRIMADKNVSKLKLSSRPNISQLRFFYKEDDGGFPLSTPVHRDVRQAMHQTRQILKQTHNVDVVPANLEALFFQLEIWVHQMHQDPNVPTFTEEMKDRNGDIRSVKELFKWMLGRSKHTLPALLVAITEQTITPGTNAQHLAACETLKSEMEDLLGDDGVLLYTSHPTAAPYHSQPIFKYFNFAYTCIFNALELPVVQVPMGLGSWDVPLGIQVVAGHGRDHVCLAVAEELEKLAGGWVAPCRIERSI